MPLQSPRGGSGRRPGLCLAALVLALALSSVAARAADRPAPRPVPPDPTALTDEKIGESIRKGALWLYGQFDPQTGVISQNGRATALKNQPMPPGVPPGDAFNGGLDCLCVYALMQCGLSVRDEPKISMKGPEMKAMVEAMGKLNLNTGHPQTYAHGLRSTALALYVMNRDELPKGAADNERKLIQEDVRWLLQACKGGAYTYVMPADAQKNDKALLDFYTRLKVGAPAASFPKPVVPWDNSNSQYGVLGVWSAAEAEVEVPTGYWALVDNYWTGCQRPTGVWDYGGGGGGMIQGGDDTLAMVCAGLASLSVTHDYLEPAVMSGRVGREPFSPAEAKGLAWFEQGNNSVNVGQPSNWWGYTLYGVERVGLASGFKHFGKHDWYKELAATAIGFQGGDGSWFGDPVNTAYALLFLARGRHPILMNKLRFEGYWANRPRDASNLARYGNKAMERPLNWQVVNVANDWQEWTDSPVLQISSHLAPKLTKDDLDKIRNFVYAGGMLYTQADGDSKAFDAFAGKLCKDLFGQELVNVPADHPILTGESLYPIKPPLPPLKMFSNGARIFMLHSPNDLTRWWQARDDKRHKQAFDLGMNLFVYNAGKRDLRNRIQTAWVPEVKGEAVHTVKVARLEYAGNWDPEPGAYKRFGNWLIQQTGYKLTTEKVKLADLKAESVATYPVAVLTGTAKQNWTPEAAAAVKAYVEVGGVLLVDLAGGTGQFDVSAEDLLKTAFPAIRPEPVPPTHPMLQAGGPGMEDLGKRKLRQTTQIKVGNLGRPLQVLSAGKGHVVYSPLDVTVGLLGTQTAGILGYEPGYAQSLVKNVMFWALDGQADK